MVKRSGLAFFTLLILAIISISIVSAENKTFLMGKVYESKTSNVGVSDIQVNAICNDNELLGQNDITNSGESLEFFLMN
jgi:hypothetical protein